MTALPKTKHAPLLRIVDKANEYFDTYEDYIIHVNEVRKYLRRLPLGQVIRFDSIPLDMQSDAVRIIVECNQTIIVNPGEEFIIITNNLI